MALITQLAMAPNATVIRVVVGDIDPILFTALRALLIAAVTFPLILLSLRKFNKYNVIYSLGAGMCLSIAMITLAYALELSQASYIVILTMAGPIVLVILTHWLMKEKIKFRAAAGVTLAAIGALIAVTFPLLINSDTPIQFYPVATALAALNCIFFPLGILLYRKASETGLSVSTSLSLSSLVIVAVSMSGVVATGVPFDIGTISVGGWAGIIYSAIGVIFLGNMLIVASFKRIGSSATASLTYLHSIVAVIIPVLLLGEQLSAIVVVGAILILFGVYLTERHHSKHHFHLLRHRH